jgi:uncharacterized protein
VFEWDTAKAAANLAKHGISFDEASTVWADSDALDVADEAHSTGEARRLAWGRTAVGRMVLVSYTIRRTDDGEGEEAIRIISARPANRKERARYAAQD